MTETELWCAMMQGRRSTPLYPQAFAMLTKPIVMRKWQGHRKTPEWLEMPLPAGALVRVVMASRFGDVGITDNLSAESGYHYRSNAVAGEVHGNHVEPAGLLTDIRLIEKPATEEDRFNLSDTP